MTSTHSSASPASFSNSTPCGDSVDMDSFINYESSVMTSPSSTSRGKAAVIERPSAPSSSSSYALQQSQHQTFSGPSHQYEQYKQQTGLPVGGLATTLALNDMSYGMNSGLPMGSDSLFDLGVSDGLYGFNPMDGRNLSIGDGTDLDLDMDSPNNDLPAFFYPAGKDEFVDPTALSGQEESSPTTTTVGRVWPGMHQQAAMAKAAQQQKQQEMIRQQQQQNQLSSQRPVPPTRGNRATGHQPSDPIVEERISRLLHQMRQNSSNSPDQAATPTNSLPHMAKLKKEEDDMDEDERLLASEEGKKLSSKERRQLRNKVSARAFRSRRKEYISQLEGEVNKGTQENSELKDRVRALMEENARLTELTKMLLSSPAFAGFMNELAVDQTSQPQAQEQPAPQPTSLQPNTRKDINPHQASQLQPQMRQQQIGLALMPEIDFSNLDLNAGWNSGMDMHFTNTQVFALTEVPEGPALDAETLSGKTTSFVPSSPSSDDSKPQVPMVERAPVTESPPETAAVTPDESIEFDESDPAFTLFADVPAPKSSTNDDFENLFGSITPEKVFARLELVVEDEAVANDTLAAEQLEHMLSSMQDSYDRIGNITFHLR